MPTISLCMIAKNDKELLENCLASISPYVDEIVIVIDDDPEPGIEDVAVSFGAKVFHRALDDFASQRNYSFEQATGDFYLWMDTDDVLPEGCGEKLRVIAQDAEKAGTEVFLFDYHYSFDERGQVNTILKRERLMKASLPWRWRYPIHEVCICEKEDGTQAIACYDPTVWIVHRKDQAKEEYKDPGRNLRFIEKFMPEYEAMQDGRMLFYAGNECMGAKKFEDAFHYYDQILAIETEWREQRALAAIREAGMMFLQERFTEAKQRCYMAIDIDERWADPYCMLGDIAMVNKDWPRAIHFFDIAANMPIPGDTILLPYDPHKYTTYPLYRKHMALGEMERLDEALVVLRTLIEKYEPDEPQLHTRAVELAALVARNRRNGLSGVTIVRGNLPPSHPAILRQNALEVGLREAGTGVNVVSGAGPMNLHNMIAVVFDSSARVSEAALSDIKSKHTDVVVDFCGPEEELSNEALLVMLRNASVVTTSSPYLLERLRPINANSRYIPDPTPFTDMVPVCTDDLPVVRILMASTDEKMVTMSVLPLLQRVAEGVGKRIEFKVLGATSMATRILDEDAFRELASWADVGIAYFPRDEQWHGAEFVTSMMAAGLPVLAMGNSAINELIDHGDSGIVCYYPGEWEGAFREVITDDGLRRKLGRRAALRARQFDRTRFVDIWAEAMGIRLAGRLDVVVPCHGQVPYIRHCVRALTSNSVPTTKFILVVNPTDPAEVEQIRDVALASPRVTVIEQAGIRNFAANCNTGIRAATATMLCLLNSDTIVTPGWDVEMMSTINKRGPCVVAAFSNGEWGWLHHEDMILDDGFRLGPHHTMEEIDDRIAQVWEFGRRMHLERAGQTQDVDWVTFVAVMMPRTIFLEVGEMDDRLNNDSEDFDFCRRLRRLGGKCIYDHGAFVFHFCGTSRDAVDGGETTPVRQAMLDRNRTILDSKIWRENRTIRFFLGKSWEPWLPEDVNRSGIGGSETCVVNIARCLTQIGWAVDVYSTELKDPLFRDGVTYRPFYSLDITSPCDVFVVSRKPDVFDHDLNAKIKVLYNHDATYGDQRSAEWPSPERVARMDYLFMLSSWHMEAYQGLYPHIPAEKFFLTQNGIDVRRFERSMRGFIRKDPKRFVYSSSGDRGLEPLLAMWKTFIDADPEFRLHVYYGLETWKRIVAARGDTGAMERIENIVRGCRQYGIVSHGRVGQTQLAEEFAASNLWLYPTWFTETSCLTAMETMAAGCRGVTSPLAALPETATTAIFIDGDCTTEDYRGRFVRAAFEELTNPQVALRNQGIVDSINGNDWRRVAAEWDALFVSELERRHSTIIRFTPEGQSVHFVVPYGGSGGVQYPINLANILHSQYGVHTKVSVVKFQETDVDIIPLLPAHPNMEVRSFDEFRSDPDSALAFNDVVTTNWQTTRVLKEMGADRRVDLGRYALIQGDERQWVPLEIISALMSDDLWQKVYVSEYLRTAFQVPGEVVHDGIDLAAFTPGPDAPARDMSLIGCILHLSPVKNTQVVVDAVAELNGEVRLLSVVAAAELNGDERIARVSDEVMWGPVSREEVARAMFRCGAWVVPSLDEGFGLVGLEAMAAGCVLITAAPGGMRTYVKPDENAIRVFNPRSSHDWGQMMRAYLGNDRNDLAEMRRRGRETAEQYTIERSAAELIGVLNRKRG